MSDHDDEELAALYREGADEPPPELDRRILAAAAEHAGRRRRAGWRALMRTGPAAGLATAAVLVLAVAVLLRSPEAPQLERRAAEPVLEEREARDLSAGSAARRAAEADRAGRRAQQRSAAESPADRQIEEPLTTGVRPRQGVGYAAPAASAATPAESPTAQDAPLPAAADPAPAAPPEAVPRRTGAAVSFSAPGCPEPYPLPDAAVVQTADRGLAVRVDGESFTLRCEDGTWVREQDHSRR